MPMLPRGTVTFLLTDLEGSTAAWDTDADAMRQALVELDGLVAKVVDIRGGVLVKPRGEGDSHFCVFERAADAVAAALDLQLAVAEDGRLSLRASVHTGEPDVRDGDYYGPAVNRAARLRAIGHGGQTLVSEASALLVGDAMPEGASLRPMGTHRLKDLTKPEVVAQLDHPRLRSEFPELRSLDTARHNLPVQVTSLIGRESEVAQLRELAALNRLVTIVGMGGAGKTRVALQVAAELVDEFPGGVWLAELAGLSEGAQAAGAVLRAVGGTEGRDEARVTLLTRLRADRTLVVLDNCEHIAGGCAELVAALLRETPATVVLATSRVPLRVGGELTYQLPVLPVPDLSALPPIDALSSYAAVQLFIERAGLVQPGFEVTSENAPAVASICARLDGIPLAIELAAARLRMLGVGALDARLGDVFTMLTGGDRTALPHHETLRAAVDWSYDMLSEPERVLWRRMSVFRSPVTLETIEAVCADEMLAPPDVLGALTALVDHSLAHVAGESSDRFGLLEVVRQYCVERAAEAGEIEVLNDRHAAWCEGECAEFASGISNRDLTAVERRWARATLSEITAAIAWREAGDPSADPALVIAAVPVMLAANAYREARSCVERALAASHPPAVERDLRRRQAQALRSLRLHRPSLDAAEAALRIARELEPAGDHHELVQLVANTAFNIDFDRAEELYEQESNRLGPESEAHIDLLQARSWRARVAGDIDAAAALIADALSVGERIAGDGPTDRLVALLRDSAGLARARGDHAEAERLAERAVSMARSSGDPGQLGVTLYFLGKSEIHRGMMEKGEEMLMEAARLLTEEENEHWVAHAVSDAACASAARGREDEMVERMAEADRIYRALGDVWTSHAQWVNVGRAALKAEQLDLADFAFTTARGLRNEHSSVGLVEASTFGLARVKFVRDDLRGARELYLEALDLASDTDTAWAARVALAEIARRTDEPEEAARWMGRASTFSHEANERWDPVAAGLRAELPATLGDEPFERLHAEGASAEELPVPDEA